MTQTEQGVAGRQWLVLAAAFLGWMFDGLEMGLFPLAGNAALRDLLQTQDVARWFAVIQATFLVGAAAGGVLFGWLGDLIGRVRAMSLSILFYGIFTGLSYFAADVWQLAGLRFLASLGMGGEWALGVALVMECWPARHRPLLAGAIGAASNVGFLLIAFIGWVKPVDESSWRWIMLAGAAPALLTIFIQLFVPESDAWKASKAAAGESGPSPFAELFGARLRGVTLVAIALGAIVLIGTWGSVQWAPSWVRQEFFKPDVANAVKSQAAAETQMASAAGAVVGCFAGSLLGGALGRRPVFFGLCLLSLVVCQWLFRGFTAYTPGFLGVMFLAGATTASFYGWLPLFLPELFPARVRATGNGIAFNIGRLVAAGGVLATGELARAFGSYAQAGAAISLIYIAGLAVIWLAPETRGRPLPE